MIMKSQPDTRFALTPRGRMVGYTLTLRERFESLSPQQQARVVDRLETLVRETKPVRMPLRGRLSA